MTDLLAADLSPFWSTHLPCAPTGTTTHSPIHSHTHTHKNTTLPPHSAIKLQSVPICYVACVHVSNAQDGTCKTPPAQVVGW